MVDGALSDSIWTRAAVLDSFTQLEPIEGPRDTTGTRCLLLYDDRYLYVGFRCPADPGSVRAPFLPRQKVGPSDFVGVGIDAYRDRRRMAYFFSTPRGVQADGMIVEGQDDDDAVDFLYNSEGRVTPNGYEVEMAIPFRSLRFPRRNPLTFGFNAIRQVPGTGLQISWAPISSDSGPGVAQIGVLEGIEGIRPGRNLQIIPSFTASRRGVLAGQGLRYETESRAGGNLKYGVTSSLTADLTVTPDFSQIEADASVVDVNSRFAVFYPERRPFFLEGSDIFRTPIEAVYTRRIADPLYGVKLTGKQGGTSIGVLQARDRSAGTDADFQIVRVRQDVFENSTIGILAGSREQSGSFNRDAGLDARFVIRDRWTLAGQGLMSWTRDSVPDPGVTRDGSAWTASLARVSRALDVGVSMSDISPRFSADMGFIPRTDKIEMGMNVAPTFFAKEGSWYQSIVPEIYYKRLHRHGATRHIGPRTDDELGSEIALNLPLSTEVGAGYYRVFTLHEGRAFPDQNRGALWAESFRFDAVQAGALVSYGDDVVFEEAVPGRSWRWDAWTDLRFTPQLDATLSVLGLQLTRSETDVRYVNAVIPRLRVSYQHNRELALRLIGEIDAQRKYDTAGARVPAETGVRLDALASYLLRPETVVYLGYGSQLAGSSVRAAQPQRTGAFVKVSYLWQL
ncbi:MAG TPA: DUF5916 domain-containing protein [Candidatus Eisenbacteria bacterium]|nr:DUF5916 domain-containing protein [Candidatus Eisenbacteria bacterium]